MDQVAQESGAAAELSRHLQKGSTGRLSVGPRGEEIDVYVMNGQVVASECPDDVRLLLRRLSAEGALTRTRAAELGAMADLGDGVFGLLLEEVPDAVMEAALFDRFRDNLAGFLGARGPVRFHPMGAVFVENFQMGHDTPSLVQECAATWRQAQQVPLSAVLAPARTDGATGDRALLVRALDGRRTVRQVLQDLPLEPLHGRAVLAAMIADGTIHPVAQAPDAEAPAPPSDRETPIPRYEERPTDMSFPKEGDTQETEVLDPWLRGLADGADDRQETEIVDPGVPRGAGDPDDVEEDVDDIPTLTAYPSARPTPSRPAFGQSMDPSAWLDPEDAVDDDILEAFTDHDLDRGGGQAGTFSQEQATLDRVEVHSLAPEDPDDAIPVGEAPVARFSAKALSEAQAIEKIAVANDCLKEIVHALDTAEGSGRGRAAVQLLIDGSPSRFAPLFADLLLDPDGSMPTGQLLRNLRTRPATEHRQLLNNGLVDLIERGLSLVMDELDDDDAIDAALEATAGYRQRIGL